MIWRCIALYLGAIVIANAVVATWGQAALVFTATLLIPFDLVTRDILHQRWEGQSLWPKMSALILTGCGLSAAVSPAVALASGVAFAAAGFSNALVYAALPRTDRWRRMNISNVAAATVDSIVFPLIAFGAADWRLCAAQSTLKIVGGAGMTAVFLYFNERGRSQWR